MNYGFVVDNRRCIGCHACSTACKSENEVPLGVNRTWVKYVEAGAFPNTRRHFQVTRCNHCANPPCVRICPVGAMYQRDDGIVEFDSNLCIGCKACLQACPYDAIYIDPDTGTAAKCHFCAHRLESQLEPACVVVCPTQAIAFGDLDDPASDVSRLVATTQVSVRKPEQGTRPKLFYVEGSELTLNPNAVEDPSSYLWADRRRGSGPLQFGGRTAEHMVQVSYNAQHEVPWHWPVPAYLVTKGLATGLFILLALAAGLGWAQVTASSAVAAGGVALLFVLATTALLVYDLEKPERFLTILLRPQWRSWLTRGAVLLVGFSTVLGAWWLVELSGVLGWVHGDVVTSVRPWALLGGLPLAVGAAIYTAYLFGQAEGRDLWQSALLPVHLLVQAVMMGGAGLLLIDPLWALPASLLELARTAFLAALIADLVVMLLGEQAMSHTTTTAARAAREITHGRYRYHYWWGSVALGHLAPLLLLALGGWAAAVAALAAIAGLYCYEHAFVMAPQLVPNS